MQTESSGANARVLLVEDDLELQQLIQRYLSKNQFEVSVESSGSHAIKSIREGAFDLIILDLMLPGKDGISICREIRHEFHGPILMLTASGDAIDHVVGLEVGADDFIQKPVEPRVLLARIRAHLRRIPATTSSLEQEQPLREAKPKLMRFGELTINVSSRTVVLAGVELTLSKPEYEMLVLLAENAGTVISRDAIFQALRQLPYDGQSRFVDMAISQIRKKLGSQADRYLKTVRGSGYLFTLNP